MNQDTPTEAAPSAITPELQAQFDALNMELRGWEVARLNPTGEWEQVDHYRPNDLGKNQAIRSTNWLTWRSRTEGRAETYRMRPIVSIDVEAAMRPAPQEAPLVLDADAELSVEELDLGAPANNEDAFTDEEMASLVAQAQAMHADPNATDEDREKLAAQFMKPLSPTDFIPPAASFAELGRKLERGDD